MDNNDILRCPYCGHPPILESFSWEKGDWMILCSTDDCYGAQVLEEGYATADEAIAAYTKRDMYR